jgi:hypothetical protein
MCASRKRGSRVYGTAHMGSGWCWLSVGEPTQRSEGGEAGIGEVCVGPAVAAEGAGCAGGDWGAGLSLGTVEIRMEGARLG